MLLCCCSSCVCQVYSKCCPSWLQLRLRCLCRNQLAVPLCLTPCHYAGCSVSTLLAILRVLGTDCSEEFNEVRQPDHAIHDAACQAQALAVAVKCCQHHTIWSCVPVARLATDVGCCSAF